MKLIQNSCLSDTKNKVTLKDVNSIYLGHENQVKLKLVKMLFPDKKR